MPSCIQITFAPSAMASSTTGGHVLGPPEDVHDLEGPAGGGLGQRRHARPPQHLVAGRVDRRDLVAVGHHVDHRPVARAVGARRQAHHGQAAVALEDAAHGVRGRAVGHSGVLGHGASMPGAPCSQVVHHRVTGKSPVRAPGLGYVRRGPRDPPRAGPALRREEHHQMARGRRLAVAIAATALALGTLAAAGCGDDDDSASGTAGGGSPACPATSRSTAPPPSGPSPRPPPRPSTARTPT